MGWAVGEYRGDDTAPTKTGVCIAVESGGRLLMNETPRPLGTDVRDLTFKDSPYVNDSISFSSAFLRIESKFLELLPVRKTANYLNVA